MMPVGGLEIGSSGKKPFGTLKMKRRKETLEKEGRKKKREVHLGGGIANSLGEPFSNRRGQLKKQEESSYTERDVHVRLPLHT